MKKIFVFLLLVTGIILCSGCNIPYKKVECTGEVETKVYSLLYEESEYEEMIQEALKEVRGIAIQNWIITSVTYLVSAEIMVLLSSRKLKLWLKEEMIAENPVESMQAEDVIMDDAAIKMEDNIQTTDSIKWNL